MKKYFVLLFLLISTVLHAQDGHIGLSMGPTIPLGDYASGEDYLNYGYASPGFNLNFEGNYIPTWYFGIGGALTFGTNYPDLDSMLVGLLDELGKIETLPLIPDDASSEFTIGNWSYVNFLVGPTFAYPAGKLQFNLKALIGLSIIMPPSQDLTIEYGNTLITSYADTQNAKFCYNLGADIILKLNGSYSVKMGCDYFHSSTDYNVEFVLNNETPLTTINRSMDINAIHTTLGLAYLF